MMMKLMHDQVLAVIEQTNRKYVEDRFHITVGCGHYQIKIPNMEYINRIDCLGFFPPPLPGVKFVPEIPGNKRLMAQLDLAEAPEYIIELLRVVLHLLSELPVMNIWARRSAPQMQLKPAVGTLMYSMHQNMTESFAVNKRRHAEKAVKVISRPTGIVECPQTEDDIPRFDFDTHEDSSLIVHPRGPITHVPTGDTGNNIPCPVVSASSPLAVEIAVLRTNSRLISNTDAPPLGLNPLPFTTEWDDPPAPAKTRPGKSTK